MDERISKAVSLLRGLGADTVEHPGGDLLGTFNALRHG